MNRSRRTFVWLFASMSLTVALTAADAQVETPSAESHEAHLETHHHMSFDADGLVMNENKTELPFGCTALSGNHDFTVRVGVDYTQEGNVFGMSLHEYNVAPCSLVTITLVNEDQVRHQWMLHGLPRYLYPQGMFHLEAAGGKSRTGSFIVPADNQTYLVHCDMTQHMEKGMKGQLLVGSGSGNLWSVPGVSRSYKVVGFNNVLAIAIVLCMAAMSFLVAFYLKKTGPQNSA